MFRTIEEFSDLVYEGEANREGDKEFWLSLERDYHNFLKTATEADMDKIFNEYNHTLEVFNRELETAVHGIDVSKIEFYDTAPREE